MSDHVLAADTANPRFKQVNGEEMRRQNPAAALNVCHRKRRIPRVCPTRASGVNSPTVSRLVGELFDHRIVGEAGTARSAAGRRPVILESNEAGRVIAGGRPGCPR